MKHPGQTPDTIPSLIPVSRFPLEIGPRIRVVGNYYFNLFLVLGRDKSLLFETGISGMVDTAIAQLESLGVSPDYLVVSHPHADHLTGLPALAERFPKARVVCGSGAPEFAAHPKAQSALVKEDRYMSGELKRRGLPPKRPPLEKSPDLKNAMVVDKNTALDLGGGIRVELMPVRGHSPGSLIAWVPGDRALFCSDAMGFHYPERGFWPLFFTGAKDYLDTIDLIEGLSPACLAPAHQGPIIGEDNVVRAIDESRTATRDIIRKIRKGDQPEDTLIQEMFDTSYRDEFTLYTPDNIMGCTRLLVKRTKELSI
ncbi:MAG TPA: Zn-dependent hydrolase [Desulfobacteraceae bacterium]|nr:Zn-dependent hydrolase [Desulfobacteraceae bacterium]